MADGWWAMSNVKLTLADFSASAAKGCCCSLTTALVSGSMSWRRARPLTARSVVLKMRADTVASSPWRRKRGTLG